MNQPFKGGSEEIIQGVKVYIPPKPLKSEILGSFYKKSEQYWRRTELPIFRAKDIDWFSGDEPEDYDEEIDWETARREEIIGQTGSDPWDLDRQGNPKRVIGVEPNDDYFCEALENFRDQEYDRIYNGVWFYNNGEPTYITGAYYFFLNWWRMDVGYGTYRNPDRQLFYLLEYVKNSNTDFGICEITGRGTGKDLCFDSLVYREDGPIQIKDIKIGDKIFGADGKLTNVIDVINYTDQLQYKVELEDGRSVECGEGHLWTIYNKNTLKKETIELKEFKNDFNHIFIPYKNNTTDILLNLIKVKSITPTSIKPSVCIAVDNKDKLFVTNDFIVTHNSSRAGCLSYLETITKKNAYCGLQSKTDEDAKDFFLEKIVEPYKDLPDFLIPINKNSSSPTKELNFSPPSRSGKNAMIYRKKDKEAIRSVLDYRNSQETAYDGKTLSFLLQDEIGKTKTANVYTRWEVNRQCLYRDGKKRGWGLLTTTVEEMESGGGENCKELWDNSDQLTRNENGRTVSWCIRYFRKASESRNFDIYGFPDIKRNLREHDIEKETLKNDPAKYIAYIQKNPENIDEAFAMSSGNCPYNASILQQSQIRVISANGSLVRVGDFQWEGGIRDTKVKFVDNPINGMWEISWMNMKENETNILIPDGEIIGINGEVVKQWKVKKNGKRFGGYDPYSAKKTVFQNKRSDAGASIYQKYHDPINIPDEFLDTFIADFAGRYPNPDDAHEQIIMSAVFFGVDYLVENNKLGAIEYINKRGYSSILMDRPSATGTKEHYHGYQGIPSNQNTIDFYVGETRSDINENGHKNKHLRIIQDFLMFDPMKTTKFDSAVGASLSIVASRSNVEIDDDTVINISDFFSTTNQSGSFGNFNQ